MDTAIFTSAFARSHGVFTPAMAQQLSLSGRDLCRMLDDGTLSRVCGLGLIDSGVDVTPIHQAMAAQLTWPNSITCFRTAARLHGLRVDDDGRSHVLVPNGYRPSRGITPHYWSVRPTEVEQIDGIVLTDRRTTIADCLGRLPEREAWGLLAWHWTRDEITEDDISCQIEERHHLYGVVRLRAMLAAIRDGALSIGEVRFHEFLRDHRFTGWLADQKIRRGGTIVARVDVLFPGLRLIIEFDGTIAHNEETAERDAARDRMLDDLGYAVEHVTWADIYERPGELRRRLRSAITDAATRLAA